MTNLNYLRFFHAVCQSQSIRQAAEGLNVAQSAVSRQIKNLEYEIGVPLFDRHPRGVRLTEAGQILAKYARATFLGQERMRSEIDDLRALRRGTVKICTVEAGVIDIIPEVIRSYRSKYPAVVIDVSVCGSQGVVDAIRNDDADLGLAYNPPYHPEIDIIESHEQHLFATVAPSHPIAGHKLVELADLQEYDVALPVSSFGIRQLVDEIMRESRLHIKPVLTTDSIQLLVNFARLNLGIAFLPYFAVKGDVQAGHLSVVPLGDMPAHKSRVEIITHTGRQLPVSAEEFLDELKSALNSLH